MCKRSWGVSESTDCIIVQSDWGFKHSIKAEQSCTADVYKKTCCKFRSDLELIHAQFFFFPSLTLTRSHPSHGSHRCWQWWLWNEFSMNKGFSFKLNSAWQKTTMLWALLGLYLFTASPYFLPLLFFWIHRAHHFLWVSASLVFSPPTDLMTIEINFPWTPFLCEFKILMGSEMLQIFS